MKKAIAFLCVASGLLLNCYNATAQTEQIPSGLYSVPAGAEVLWNRRGVFA